MRWSTLRIKLHYTRPFGLTRLSSHVVYLIQGQKLISSVKDAVKHGFTYELGGIKKIFGFNGSNSPVDGLMGCEIRLGPSGNTAKVEFLVTPNVTIPILGCPDLAVMGLMMDCKGQILTDDQVNVIRCFAVHNLKN